MESLEKILRRASSLARCDDFIRNRRDNKVVSSEETNWILNLFIINPISYEKDTGDISFMLFNMDNNLIDDLVPLSDKIKRNEKLNQVDWDLILCGIEKYRSKLLRESFPQQNCGDIW